MKRIISLLVIISVAVTGINADAKTKRKKSRKRTAKSTIVQPAPTGFEYVEGDTGSDITDLPKYPPEYPGGTQGLVKFLSDNIKYPKRAQKNGVQGTVVVEFIVEKTGEISNIKVLKSVSRELDKEAIRVVKKIKHFIPGYNEDHAPVRTSYTLPVNFKLE